MIFTSYEFVFLFAPAVIIIYFALSKTKNISVQQIFLILASLFFYGFFNVYYLWIMAASICINYSIRILMKNAKCVKYKKLYFYIGVIFNILLLGYYKYYNFFVSNINSLFDTNIVMKNILLPLGISFFTFQQLSFLLSVYKDDDKVESFVEYCLCVTFFPHLVAGPIVLYSEMMPQFQNTKNRFVNYENVSRGLYIFFIGLFKKIVIADTIAVFANNGYEVLSHLSFVSAWVTALSYTLQIYFDFSGYSDMAIGLGKIFNIDLPVNFNSPYKSRSIKEFWNRWHITLGRVLSTFIYIPLGGSRQGKLRTCINLLITFLISGLWHGAAWTFIVWGALHGAASVIYRLFDKQLSKIPDWINIFFTFMFVNATWVLFRATGWQQAIKVYKGMINFREIGIGQIADLAFDGVINLPSAIDLVYTFSIISAGMIIVFCSKNSIERTKNFYPSYRSLFFTAVIFLISIIHMSRVSPFIYFNF